MAVPALRHPPDLTVITGAAGWLGRALLAGMTAPRGIAARDGRIRALVHAPADVPAVAATSDRVEVHVGDVADPDVARRLFRGADGADAFHCAAVIHPARTAEFDRVNVGGTRAVLDASRGAGVRRLVHVSSNSPFGTNPTPGDRFRAEEPFNPYMGYGRSKMEAEILVREANGGELETTVVRPPWFYGPHQPERQTRFFTAVRSGRFPLVGDGSNLRSMVYVDNLVQGLVRAELVERAAGRAYWVADRRPYAMREVLGAVRDALRAEGHTVSDRSRRLPAAAGDLAERLDAVLQSRGRYVPEIHVLGELGKTIACDISQSETELGYAPEVELFDGMRRSIAWCREVGIEL